MGIPALGHEHAGNLPVLLQHLNKLLHLKQVVSGSWPELDSHPRACMCHAHNATDDGFLVRHSDAEYHLAPCRKGCWRFNVTCTNAYISQSVGRDRRCRPGCAAPLPLLVLSGREGPCVWPSAGLSLGIAIVQSVGAYSIPQKLPGWSSSIPISQDSGWPPSEITPATRAVALRFDVRISSRTGVPYSSGR